MNLLDILGPAQTRRSFLRSSLGLGTLAAASLWDSPSTAGDAARGVVHPLQFAPRAKRVVYMCMAGGPSHLETFDPKPELEKLHGEPMPESFTKGQPIAQLQGQDLRCFAPQFKFIRAGENGVEVCDQFPHLAGVADHLCVIRSLKTEAINHDPAHTFINTGSTISGRPSMGSWILYGLGSESENLPGFVVLTSLGKGGQAQPIARRQWHSGFLSSKLQGVEFHASGDPVLYVNSPPGISSDQQRQLVDVVSQLNRTRHEAAPDPEIENRIAQYELAFRMQTSVPGLIDISSEPKSVLDLYGTQGADGSFAANCLLARRLAERGVRFIQLYHRAWDHHSNVKRSIEITAREVDKASAALVTDLAQRGMLDDTLVVWGGEFGRTPMAQGTGRDHHIKGFSMWLAGAGVKGGVTYGATDELGYNAVENVVHVHDLHATMLHLLGIDHERLTYRFQGRDFRLTDVHGHVVKDILTI